MDHSRGLRGKLHLLRAFVRPGIGLKRWLALFLAGLVLAGIGIGFTTKVGLSPRVLAFGQLVTLKVLPPLWRGAVFAGIGTLLMGVGALRLYQVLASRGRRPAGVSLIESLHEEHRRSQGARIVAIGGGTGLATLLRGLKHYTGHVVAIVTVADDGGSSGRLRSELGIPPPGDARNCLVALSEVEPLLARLLDYRFKGGDSLGGHSLGNLLLAALTEMEGNFEKALEAASALMAVQGRIVPVSPRADLVLRAETEEGQLLLGESSLGSSGRRLKRVWLEPPDAPPSPQALEAIAEADLIVIGPGSLYTSLIPNFLVRGISAAVQATPAPKVFVCNVATQRGETDSFGVSQHLQVLQRHTGVTVTHLLVNTNVRELPAEWGQKAVAPELPKDFRGTYLPADVVSEVQRTRHDPDKLARALVGLAESGRRNTARRSVRA